MSAGPVFGRHLHVHTQAFEVLDPREQVSRAHTVAQRDAEHLSTRRGG